MSQEDEGDQEPREDRSEDYYRTYLNVMSDLQRQYNLRNINVVVGPPKKAPKGQALASQPAKDQHMKEVVQQKIIEKDIPKDAPPKDK